jgi:hypothetical protein
MAGDSLEATPLFHAVYILGGCMTCANCKRGIPLESSNPQFSDAYYLELARKMDDAGWEAVGDLEVRCPECVRAQREHR